MVALDPPNNPFNPGPGTIPLYVAGRAQERELINKTLVTIADLSKNKKRDQSSPGPLAPIKIVGPRGVGKTILLHEAWKKGKELGIHVLHVPQLESFLEVYLLDGLVSADDYKKFGDQLIHNNNGSAESPEAYSEQEYAFFVKHLRKKLKQKPVLLLLDEAMHYDGSVFESLLQLCQKLMIEDEPLAVIMAGTPQLDPFLSQLNVGFIKRSAIVRINLLSDEDTRDALAKPFAMQGIKAAPAAIDYLAALTDNYPFFIQIAGSQAWDTMLKAGKREVSLALAKKAQVEIEEQRDDFYHGLYSRIMSALLLQHAFRIMEILEMNDGKAGRETLLSGLAGKQRGVYGKEHLEAFAQLVDLGFIWEQGGLMEAGKPSFFSYCEQVEKEVQKGKI